MTAVNTDTYKTFDAGEMQNAQVVRIAIFRCRDLKS